jgi:hypothetical protein
MVYQPSDLAAIEPGALTSESSPQQISEGGIVRLRVIPAPNQSLHKNWDKLFTFKWTVSEGKLDRDDAPEVTWDTTGLRTSSYKFSVTVTPIVDPKQLASIIKNAHPHIKPQNVDTLAREISDKHTELWQPLSLSFPDGHITVTPRPVASGETIPVTMRRAENLPTDDQALWIMIRNGHEGISFPNYKQFIDDQFACLTQDWHNVKDSCGKNKSPSSSAPFPFVDAYNRLKVATEFFLLAECCVISDRFPDPPDLDLNEEPLRLGRQVSKGDILDLWNTYLSNGKVNNESAIPYLALVRGRLAEVPLWDGQGNVPKNVKDCSYILTEKLTHPCLLELIWSYWHEEGMLVQTMNAISLRFQNRRTGDRDPLANLDLDPLRPLNNLLWGYIQDEQHRLSLARRAYEYDHHYGLPIYGKAVPQVRGADSRSKFLEAFHNLLYLCQVFFNQDDDTTVVADGFPVLNALKDVHILLAEGAHNQFGDLPSTARMEMLMQQWLLARPEMREFLSSRVMVPYTETWMDRVDTVKRLQGWTDISIMHFHKLADFGEQLLLSIRYGSWNQVDHPEHAANWARYWRSEIQGYVHSYRSVTAVDLTAEGADSQQRALRYQPPAMLLVRRLAAQTAKR